MSVCNERIRKNVHCRNIAWMPGSSPGMTPPCGLRPLYSPIHLSNSPRSRAKSQLANRRDSSPLLFVRRGGRRPLPSLTGVRERSAERRYGLHLAPCGAACRVTGTRTPRRSTVAFVVPRDRASGAGPEGCPSRYPDGFRRPSSVPVQPLKAAPVVGRTVTRGVPGRGLRIPGRRRHTLLRQHDAS